MPSWNDLLQQVESLSDAAATTWIVEQQNKTLDAIVQQRGGRNVLFYASGFLQKSPIPSVWLSITHEEINGFMSTIYGMD